MSDLGERAGTVYVLLFVPLVGLACLVLSARGKRLRLAHHAAWGGGLSLMAGFIAFREVLGRELAAAPITGAWWVLALGLGFLCVGLSTGVLLVAILQGVAAWRRR